jgi:hypothetical protein
VWRGLKVDVSNYVKQCDICQHAKHEQSHPAGLLQPLPIPEGARQDISLDFIEGLPKSDGYSVILVVVDRFSKDKVFTNLFWKELFKLWNTALLTSTAYHPQIDGQTERVNQCLEMFLRCSVHSTLRRWKAWLPHAEFLYNTSYHSSLGCTPFKALYGYEANVASTPMILVTEQRSVQQMFTDRQIHTKLLKSNLKAA